MRGRVRGNGDMEGAVKEAEGWVEGAAGECTVLTCYFSIGVVCHVWGHLRGKDHRPLLIFPALQAGPHPLVDSARELFP